MSGRDPDWLDDYLMQIGHTFNMVAELPGWLASGELASPRYFHPWHGLAEAWLLNARLLAEFFLDGGRRTDVGPRDYLADEEWRLDDDDQRDATIRSTLIEFATGPNKHAMHFDAEHRGDTPLWSPPSDDHAEILSLLFDLGYRFASRLDEPHRSTMTAYLSTANSLRAWPPPLLHADWSALPGAPLRIGPPTSSSSLLLSETSRPHDDALTFVLVTVSGTGLTATAWVESLDGDTGVSIPERGQSDDRERPPPPERLPHRTWTSTQAVGRRPGLAVARRGTHDQRIM